MFKSWTSRATLLDDEVDDVNNGFQKYTELLEIFTNNQPNTNWAPEIEFHRVGFNSALIKVDECAWNSGTSISNKSSLWKGSSYVACAKPDDESEFVDSGLLRFWTSIATLSIHRSASRHREGHIMVGHTAVNTSTHSVLDLSSIDLSMGSTAHLGNSSTSTRQAAPEVQPSEAGSVLADEILDIDFIIIGRSPSDPFYLDAFAVEWKESNFLKRELTAYRIGLALVPEELWIDLPGKQWKLVTLG
ncbi:hypothetical protein K402DRAFT_420960 [Aulographum hederae CBS 113979]|uniref:Uncharacterized protein n=1 Tax=Aulographum hederae CBS 113979 TaxID=1176131 RepID=A0A6G1H0I5_9PEZI|nr:hypothetical protein K402DRAFT_420960 [Aulographum hederae CBS 113979]